MDRTAEHRVDNSQSDPTDADADSHPLDPIRWTLPPSARGEHHPEPLRPRVFQQRTVSWSLSGYKNAAAPGMIRYRDDLRSDRALTMAITTHPTADLAGFEGRLLLRDVGWNDYEAMLEIVGERHGKAITFLVLRADRHYEATSESVSFPGLRPDDVERLIELGRSMDKLRWARELKDWRARRVMGNAHWLRAARRNQ
jgi:hypothetical protein